MVGDPEMGLACCRLDGVQLGLGRCLGAGGWNSPVCRKQLSGN